MHKISGGSAVPSLNFNSLKSMEKVDVSVNGKTDIEVL